MIHKTTNPIARAFCCVGLLVGLALVGLPEQAQAVLMRDGSNEVDYRNLATQYAPSLGAVSLTDSFGTFTISGVLLNDSWLLTAGHGLLNPRGAGNASVNGITQGTSSIGSLTPVLGTYLFPGHVAGSAPNTPDLALMYLGPNSGLSAPSLTIGSVSAGAVVTSIGFGEDGTPSTGFTPPDGNARAWEAGVSSSTFGGFSPTYYQSSRFSPSQGLSLNGRGASGDSGSPVFNSIGQLVGINVAASSGTSPIGSTEFVRLSESSVLNWIQQTITPAEPKILSLTREGSNLRLAWQGKGGSNYVVQAASALGGTNTFTDLASPLALPGVGSITTNFLDLGILTNAPARFYRIRLN